MMWRELIALLGETREEAQRESFGQFASLLRTTMQSDFSQRMKGLGHLRY